jgi:hypothetical protein
VRKDANFAVREAPSNLLHKLGNCVFGAAEPARTKLTELNLPARIILRLGMSGFSVAAVVLGKYGKTVICQSSRKPVIATRVLTNAVHDLHRRPRRLRKPRLRSDWHTVSVTVLPVFVRDCHTFILPHEQTR